MDCCTSRPKEKKATNGNSIGKSTPRAKAADLQKQQASKLAEIEARVDSVKNRFVQSKRFKAMVKSAFDDVDIDKSNTLDGNEVYIAVLLLYLKIAGVCKGAIPPTRAQIEELILKFDNPKNPGHMELENFEQFCQFLCSQIAGRVTVQMILQIVVAPLLGLVAAEYWQKLMMVLAPDMFKLCSSYVPSEVVVTLFVGIGVSLFVPPLMGLVDKFVMKEAGAAEAKLDAAAADQKPASGHWWSRAKAA